MRLVFLMLFSRFRSEPTVKLRRGEWPNGLVRVLVADGHRRQSPR
jgi:hypothetical protein